MSCAHRAALAGLVLIALGGAATDERALEAPIVERAREALRAAGVDVAPLEVTLFEPATWPDTSLGCGQPGTRALQVVSSGYRVRLAAGGVSHEVHVSAKATVICRFGGELRLRRPARPVSLRHIDALTDQAKALLASATGAPRESVRVVALVAMSWADAALGCPPAAAPGASEPAPKRVEVSGYRIVLALADRSYTFHTDGVRVIACPPIEDR